MTTQTIIQIKPEEYFIELLQKEETLVSVIKGVLRAESNPYSFAPVFIGLTSSRLILFFPAWKKIKQNFYSIPLSLCQKVIFIKNSFLGNGKGLRLFFNKDKISIRCEKNILPQVENFCQNFLTVKNSYTPPQNPDFWLDAAEQLVELRIFTGAQEALALTKPEGSGSGSVTRYEAVRKKISTSIWALRVGGLFFLGLTLFVLFFSLIGAAIPNPIGITLAIIILINLLQGKSTWRSAGLFIGLFNVLGGLFMIAAHEWGVSSYFDLALWTCFGLSIILALSGKPSTIRTWISVIIFLIGIPGMFLLAFVLSILGKI